MHRFWRCPLHEIHRARIFGPGGADAVWKRIPLVTATLGLPTVMEGVRNWQRGWTSIAGEVRPAEEYFVDGSGIHPKDPTSEG